MREYQVKAVPECLEVGIADHEVRRLRVAFFRDGNGIGTYIDPDDVNVRKQLP